MISKKHMAAGYEQRYIRSAIRQGDILLVNFGGRNNGSRNLCGARPVYVMNRQPGDMRGSLLVIPLFRQESKDSAWRDVEIRPTDCKGLKYAVFAQPLNLQKIRRNQIVRRIGHVNGTDIHENILTSMWEQVDSYKEGLVS